MTFPRSKCGFDSHCPLKEEEGIEGYSTKENCFAFRETQAPKERKRFDRREALSRVRRIPIARSNSKPFTNSHCGGTLVCVKNFSVSPLVVELIPDPEQGGYTARVPDIPAYGEGKTEEEAIADLKEALQAYVEAFGLEDATARMSRPSSLRQLDWNLAEFAGG